MPRQEEIAELRQEIEKKEGQLYRANLEMTGWNKGKHQAHSNARMSRLLVDSSRKEIADLNAKLRILESLSE
jgi:hypothetical protein